MSARLYSSAWRTPAFVALALPGCSEWSFADRNGVARDPLLVEERFVQAPLPKVDLLWVIDDTSSMADEHDALAGTMGAFANTLAELGLAWQVGVVTTDLSGVDAGRLQGDPWILTPALDDPAEALVQASDVGVHGNPPEAGFGAAYLALTEPLRSGDNRSFRRSDAALHVIVLSDSDDDSASVLGADPVGAFEEFLAEEAAITGMDARLSAVVGDVPSGCTWDGGTALPGAAYAEVALATGGVVASVCEADLSPVVEAIGEASASWPDTFTLQAVPVADSVRVSVDGARLDQGWTLDLTLPGIVFDEAPGASAEIVVTYEVEDG